MGSKPTPTPWRVAGLVSIDGPQGELVATAGENKDAFLIVRAVNAHAPLVEALRECLDELKHYWANAGIDATQDLEQAREALRLAEGDAS